MRHWDQLDEKTEWLYRKLTDKKTEETDDHRLEQLANKLSSPGYLQEKLRQQEKFNYRQGERKFIKATQKRSPQRILQLCSVAAVLIPFCIAVLLLLQKSPVISGDMQVASEIPRADKQKAYLRISATEEYSLQQDTFTFHNTQGVDIKVDNQGIHYYNGDTCVTTNRKSETHTLVVPRGGEYSITLADDTKVWLNSDSELKYPAYFTGDTREVTIIGEAYFEVSKREDKPFVVHTKHGRIQVWGTSFNVEAYKDEESFVATLVSGSISCSLSNGQYFRMSPNDQVVYRNHTIATLTQTDTRIAAGWKDGVFLFRNKRFEDITRQLSRWYDLNIIYLDDKVKDLHFSGDLNRFKSIRTFMEMFEKSAGVKLYLEDNTLYITSNRP